jgi:hypothetical protein
MSNETQDANEFEPGDVNRVDIQQINAEGKIIYRATHEWFGSQRVVADTITLDLYDAIVAKARGWSAASVGVIQQPAKPR